MTYGYCRVVKEAHFMLVSCIFIEKKEKAGGHVTHVITCINCPCPTCKIWSNLVEFPCLLMSAKASSRFPESVLAQRSSSATRTAGGGSRGLWSSASCRKFHALSWADSTKDAKVSSKSLECRLWLGIWQRIREMGCALVLLIAHYKSALTV